MEKIKCLIADDSSFFRKLMRDLCVELSLEVVKDYEAGELLLNDLKAKCVDEPDVIFLDINMPGRSGKDLLEDILDEIPEVAVIMISTVSDSHVVNECLRIGASNYINKDADLKTMKEIIQSTLKINGLL